MLIMLSAGLSFPLWNECNLQAAEVFFMLRFFGPAPQRRAAGCGPVRRYVPAVPAGADADYQPGSVAYTDTFWEDQDSPMDNQIRLILSYLAP